MAEKQPIDWNSYINDVAAYTNQAVNKVADQAKESAAAAQSEAGYGVDQLVRDVEFFWGTLASTLTAALDTFNQRVVKRDGK